MSFDDLQLTTNAYNPQLVEKIEAVSFYASKT